MGTQAQFSKGKIHDVVVKALGKYLDERGWLAELFRSDEIDSELHAGHGLHLHDPSRRRPWTP